MGSRKLTRQRHSALPKPASRIRPRTRRGRCYELAGRYQSDDERWLLVHGTVRSLLYERGWIGHAWLKLGDCIYDPVINQSYLAHEYVSHLGAEEAATFTRREAADALLKFRHWGPWVVFDKEIIHG